MSDGNYQTEWMECDLNAVMRYFAGGFEPKADREIWQSEWFIDTQKGRVVFKLCTRDKQ
jgi:hypothetical protein